MKKFARISVITICLCFVFGFALMAPEPGLAKMQTVRFVLVGANEGSPEVGAEPMALNMYLGALD